MAVHVLSILCMVFFSNSIAERSRVTVKQGEIEGKILKLNDGQQPRRIQAFEGIPYASPPVGSLRFLPPVTNAKWQGTLRAIQRKPPCPQQIPNITNKTASLNFMSQAKYDFLSASASMLSDWSEDCLYLNVYVPVNKNNSPLPVLVYIHGNSFQWGSANIYNYTTFASFGNMIIVTLNYRLGILGFFNFEHFENPNSLQPMNVGLFDQIAALHWIKENIADFNGDSKKITLMGHGSGAASIMFLMTSTSLPANMFHQVILMSGTPKTYMDNFNKEKPYQCLSEKLNCSNNGTHHLYTCAKKSPIATLMTASRLCARNFPIDSWGPKYDNFLVHSFKNQMWQFLDKISQYSVLMGSLAMSPCSLNERQCKYGVTENEKIKTLANYVSKTYEGRRKEVLSAIINEYTDWKDSERLPATLRDDTLEAIQDGNNIIPLLEIMDYHSTMNKNSWLYIFDQKGNHNFGNQRIGESQFESDLKYILGYPITIPDDNEYARDISFQMMEYWSNFIHDGNPNGKKVPYWPSYDTKKKRYMHIGTKLKQKDNYKARKTALWLNLIPDLLPPARENSKEEKCPKYEDDTILLYDNILQFLPSLKNLRYNKAQISPSSREVVWTNVSHTDVVNEKISKEESLWNITMEGKNDIFSNYSTALSVTIAIGCCLLVFNLLIFSAVYFQREIRSIEKYSQKLEIGRKS